MKSLYILMLGSKTASCLSLRNDLITRLNVLKVRPTLMLVGYKGKCLNIGFTSMRLVKVRVSG